VAYVRGTGGALPFGSGAFDAVVVCLVLEHVVDLDSTFDEMARVLRPGGRLVLFLNHPLFQTPGSGWVDDRVLDPPEQYWRVGPYLEEDESLEEVEAGVQLPFVHRPLSRYVNGLADRGLLVTHMEEPAPPPGFVALAAEYAGAATIPRLLLLRAEGRRAEDTLKHLEQLGHLERRRRQPPVEQGPVATDRQVGNGPSDQEQ
jgi:SAM-dependent methyltransferase